MRYKKILAMFSAVAALGSLAACGGVKSDSDSATDASTITIGTTDKVTAVDPAGSFDNGSFTVQTQIYPFLYSQDYDSSEISPDIAADNGTWSADGKELTVKIKPGLKFANGNSLTSKDVKYTFDRVKKINDPKGPSSLLANIESVETTDDTTVVFKAAVPNDVTLKQVLASPAAPIVDHAVYPADRAATTDEVMKGQGFAGPYKLDQYRQNEVAQFVKNPEYKGLTPAKNKTIQLKYFADNSNLKMAVQQGNVDVVTSRFSPTDIEDLKKDGKVKIVKGPGGEERFIVFNFRLQPYGEKSTDPNPKKASAVRYAVADLIDRDAIAKRVYKGTYTPLYSFIPEGLTGHEDTLKQAYGDGNGKPSLDKAKKRLEEAGVSTPVDLKLQYSGDHYGSSATDEYAAIKSQLESGGLFKVDLQQTEWTQYLKDRVVTKDSDGSYPAYQLGWFPDYPDPDDYLSPFFRDGNFINNGYKDVAMNALIAQQAGEQDKDKRTEMLKQVQEMATKDLPIIPLLQGDQVAVTSSNIKGVVLDSSFRFRYAPLVKS